MKIVQQKDDSKASVLEKGSDEELSDSKLQMQWMFIFVEKKDLQNSMYKISFHWIRNKEEILL